MVTWKQGATSVVWAAVTELSRSPLFFIDQEVELNLEIYCHVILIGSLLPWAKKHFKKHPWAFQQVLAHGAKKTQEWLSANVLHFISKEEWPPSCPDLNPLNFGIWAYFESKVLAMHH